MIIKVEIQGDTPLLCNRFTDANAEAVENGTTKTMVGRKGTPRERAEPKLYVAGGVPVIPGPNIFRAIIDAGRFHKSGRSMITTGKSSLIPGGVMVLEADCPIVNPECTDPTWEVDSRRVVIPGGGAIMCHRPRFDAWRLAFTLDVDESMFDESIVRLLVDDAGKKIGLGDFRPARKGPFGRFSVVSWDLLRATVKRKAS